MWMGDLETEMLQVYYSACKNEIHHVDILFHPHHGRSSASLSSELLTALSPQLIVIGNAPSENTNYGDSDKTITRNSSGDLVFINEIINNKGYVHVYSQHKVDNLPSCLEIIDDLELKNIDEDNYYCGSLKV